MIRSVDATTKLFGLLGHPVSHSLSPIFQNFMAVSKGVNAVYLAFDVVEEDFAQVVEGFAKAGCVGFNVTVPHKEAAYRLSEFRDDFAELTGAVNTLKFEKEKDWVKKLGYNTDVKGFVDDVKKFDGIKNFPKEALILGAGGAARAAVVALLTEGWKVFLANRTLERARVLRKDILERADRIGYAGEFGEIEVLPLREEVLRDVKGTLIVNATSLGLHPEDPSPVSENVLSNFVYAYDLIYHETRFQRMARDNSLKVRNGLGMLVEQGILSFSIWFGEEMDFDTVYSFLIGYLSYAKRRP